MSWASSLLMVAMLLGAAFWASELVNGVTPPKVALFTVFVLNFFFVGFVNVVSAIKEASKQRGG